MKRRRRRNRRRRRRERRRARRRRRRKGRREEEAEEGEQEEIQRRSSACSHVPPAWMVQVRNIMSSPRVPTLGMYSFMILYRPFGITGVSSAEGLADIARYVIRRH